MCSITYGFAGILVDIVTFKFVVFALFICLVVGRVPTRSTLNWYYNQKLIIHKNCSLKVFPRQKDNCINVIFMSLIIHILLLQYRLIHPQFSMDEKINLSYLILIMWLEYWASIIVIDGLNKRLFIVMNAGGLDKIL